MKVEPELRFYFREYADICKPGDGDCADVETLDCVLEPDYPIENLAGPGVSWADWAAGERQWFAQQKQAHREDGRPQMYDDMLNAPIEHPVVICETALGRFVWDGNHRIAASVTLGRKTIPAVIGRTPERMAALMPDSKQRRM